MKIDFAKRPLARRALAVTLVLVAAASMVAGRERPALEVVQPRSAVTAPAAGTAADIDLAKLERREATAPQIDPFAPRSFAPPPVREARVRTAEPAAPSAPPLPFVYFGKVTENGKTDVFVMRDDEVIGIVAGGKIDDQYRVDAISDSSISFTYLPLKMQQSLDLSEAGG
jgi:hypothetical protein